MSVDEIKELFHDHQSSLFKILDFLLEVNIPKSIYEINSLLEHGEPPLRLTAGLISQIRMYAIVLLLSDKKDISEISSLANITNPKRIYFIKRKIKDCSPKYLINIMIKLLNIELLIKKGNNPKDVFTENFITLTEGILV